jgi:hypothetical protein
MSRVTVAVIEQVGSQLNIKQRGACSSWWRKDLGQMQALLMNAPNKDAFYKLFKVKYCPQNDGISI